MAKDLQCYPAIDIRDGKCVRLLQGNFADETIFGDPLEQALRYVDEGATWLHIVDLDAARGDATNRDLIAKMIELSGVHVQVGGGIRDDASASFYLDAGARRVIVGTAGIEHREIVDGLIDRYPGHIGLGLDHRLVGEPGEQRREVAVRGWESSSGITLDDAIDRYEQSGIDAVIVTDISRDGMLSGPDHDGYAHLLATTSLPVIASGGIKDLDDLVALAALQVTRRQLEGVVVGRALLSGAMTLKEALVACAR